MSLALVDGDRLHIRLAGFDYAATGAQEFTYFNAVYYEPILWGIEHGIAHYSFGTATYDAKLARGCTPDPVYAVVLWPERLRERAWEHAAAREVAMRERVGLPPVGESSYDDSAASA